MSAPDKGVLYSLTEFSVLLFFVVALLVVVALSFFKHFEWERTEAFMWAEDKNRGRVSLYRNTNVIIPP